MDVIEEAKARTDHMASRWSYINVCASLIHDNVAHFKRIYTIS